ncbi:MAG: helix-turn-helix domain-containing protein [Balneolaceae bacterium]
MQTFIPSREELEEIISNSVRENMVEALPEAIRIATEKKILRTDDVMKILNCSRRHIQYLRDSGQLSYSQNGRTIIYERSDIEDFIKKNKVRKS